MIQVTVRDAIATIVLNRPEQRNAMSWELVRQLLAALERLEANDEVGTIVLRGEGRGFCAGSDLAMLARLGATERAAFEADSGRVAQMLSNVSFPVVAAVSGFAIGGGLTLAAACDIVVSEPQAKWGLPETPIGLFPAWGLGLLTDRVGPVWARRLAWGIDTLDGAEAGRIGLADLVTNDAVAAANDVAARLAALPRKPSRAVKAFFRQRPTGEVADQLANAFFQRMCETPEGATTFAKYDKRD